MQVWGPQPYSPPDPFPDPEKLGWFLWVCLKPAVPIKAILLCAWRVLFPFIYLFSVRGGGRVWIVFISNVQPENQQLLIMDEFHRAQKATERRNVKERSLAQVEMISMNTNLLEKRCPEERSFSNVALLAELCGAGCMAVVKGGRVLTLLPPCWASCAGGALKHLLGAEAAASPGDALLVPSSPSHHPWVCALSCLGWERTSRFGRSVALHVPVRGQGAQLLQQHTRATEGPKRCLGTTPSVRGVLHLKAVLVRGSWLGNAGGSGVTAVAGEQQSDVLLSGQDSGDSLCREHTDNYSAPKPGIWGCN